MWLLLDDGRAINLNHVVQLKLKTIETVPEKFQLVAYFANEGMRDLIVEVADEACGNVLLTHIMDQLHDGHAVCQIKQPMVMGKD